MNVVAICPLCNGSEIKIYWNRVWTNRNMRVYKCETCEALFLWPQLENWESDEYYLHYSNHLHERGVAQNETPLETFQRRIPLGNYRLEVAREFLREGDSILEVGGGCGNFLVDVIQKRMASKAVLVESCKNHLEFARQIYGIEGYENLEEVPGMFDRILLFHVLEHLTKPAEFLERSSRYLSDDGIMIVEIPCSQDPLLSLYDCTAYKDFYFQPMHPYVYNKKSLEILFNQCGYEVIEFISIQRYSLSNHLQWLSKGMPGGNTTLAEAIGKECEDLYINKMQSRGTTDTIFGIFQKA